MRLFAAPGLRITEHEFTLPLKHAEPEGPLIDVFVRELTRPDGESLPYLLYFAGGPGHESPRPLTSELPEWLVFALDRFRVLLLDQRGTGRSEPLDGRTLDGRSAADQADYLTNFRADSIVDDAELIRQALGIDRWSVLGESFGGFCVLRYLSQNPESLDRALISGGLPPLGNCLDEVYKATYGRVRGKVDEFYERYPVDKNRLQASINELASTEVFLPSGDRLTSRRFRQLGLLLGMGSGFEQLHYLLERPFQSVAFALDLERALPFGRNPLYAVLHEACWADGGSTGWSAARIFESSGEILLTGEHVFPWMFDEYGALQPLREAAELLAYHRWPPLYDEAQLRRNDVPVAAIVYSDDMYVESRFSLQTAGVIGRLRPWWTNEWEHDGLRASGSRVIEGLLRRTDSPL